jgi:branched-chain amino acid transport system ATP-binding protein
MLEISNISVLYGKVIALDNISLKINEGEFVTIIGANGAGKTSLLKSIAGLVDINQGKAVFKGIDITKLRADQIVKLGLSLCPEERQLFPKMTVYENLLMGAYYRKDDFTEDLMKVYSLFPIMKERTNQLAENLSGGEQQMLAIGRSLMSKPDLICFDEPSLGLAPLLVDEVIKTIKELNNEGKTIILVEQHVEQAFKIAERGFVLENGKISISDRIENLRNSDKIKKAYLGGS